MIDVRLYAVEFVHIYMMMRLDVIGCVMMLYGYFGFKYILYLCLCDGQVGYLFHSFLNMLCVKVSDVNGSFSIID